MKRFKNILFFADGGTEPGPALERAVTRVGINDARLTIIYTRVLVGTPFY